MLKSIGSQQGINMSSCSQSIHEMSLSSQEIFYLPAGKEIEIFSQAHKSKIPILLKGPTGCGKTRFIELMAERLELELITVSCNEDTSATDLLGRHLLVGGNTEWMDGPVTRAIRNGALLYLDEISEARPDAIVVIHSLADHRRELFLDRTGERIKAVDKFMFVGSYNPSYQKSLRELKPSTRQRFASLALEYPNEKDEVTIVSIESGIEHKTATQIVKIGRKIRRMSDLSLMESVSTRLLITAAKLIESGIPPRTACICSIAEPLTDDDDERIALRQLIEISI